MPDENLSTQILPPEFLRPLIGDKPKHWMRAPEIFVFGEEPKGNSWRLESTRDSEEQVPWNCKESNISSRHRILRHWLCVCVWGGSWAGGGSAMGSPLWCSLSSGTSGGWGLIWSSCATWQVLNWSQWRGHGIKGCVLWRLHGPAQIWGQGSGRWMSKGRGPGHKWPSRHPWKRSPYPLRPHPC